MKRIGLIACLVLTACAAGCTTHYGHTQVEQDPHLTYGGRVQFDTSRTKYVLQVARVDSKRTEPGDLLKVVLTLRNMTRDDVWVDVRTTFLGKDRHQLEETNWERVLLDARTVTEYTCTSLSDKAMDYKVIVRRPDKGLVRGR